MPVVRPVKVVSVSSSEPNPLLLLRRSWRGSAAVLGEGNSVAVVEEPCRVVVPVLRSKGRIGRDRAASLLRSAVPWPADVYVVAVVTPEGVVGHGMCAVPAAVVPAFTTGTLPGPRGRRFGG